ncbi:MAG: hypothetical protein Q8P67_20550 [archaeon]|nr:hypothetical protein [archaeon]
MDVGSSCQQQLRQVKAVPRACYVQWRRAITIPGPGVRSSGQQRLHHSDISFQ